MKLHRLILPAISLLVVPLIWVSCGTQADEAQSETKITVKTTKITRKKMSFPVHTSGMLSSKKEINLSFKTGGILEKLFVDEGQGVKKGKLLAQLNLSEIKAREQQARSAFEKSKRDLKRVERLYADSVATLEQLQNAQTAVKVARSDLQIAEFNLRHSKIYAPSKGKILKRFVETNELVNAGMPIFTFGAIGNDWVIRVGVTERDVLRISLGDTAQVTFDAYPDQKFLATVTEIAEAIDPRSGTFEVELSVDPGNEKLKSGFVARAEIFLSRKEVFALIPIEAFVEGAGNEGFVYTVNVDEQSVRKIPVTVLEVLNDRVAIRSQLSPVDDVVTEGSAYLSDGSAVQLIE